MSLSPREVLRQLEVDYTNKKIDLPLETIGMIRTALSQTQNGPDPAIVMVKDYRAPGLHGFAMRQYDGTYWMDDCDVYKLEELREEYEIQELSDKDVADALWNQFGRRVWTNKSSK